MLFCVAEDAEGLGPAPNPAHTYRAQTLEDPVCCCERWLCFPLGPARVPAWTRAPGCRIIKGAFVFQTTMIQSLSGPVTHTY